MAKRVVMIIAFEGFRDEEYFEPKAVLEKAGIEVVTASTKVGVATGKLSGITTVNLSLKDVVAKEFDAVIFVGGPGSYDFFEHPDIHKIVKDAKFYGKIIGAICAATAILAKADILTGVRAACFEGVYEIIKGKGAKYEPGGLAVDGNIITADGPAHARQFGEEIAKALA